MKESVISSDTSMGDLSVSAVLVSDHEAQRHELEQLKLMKHTPQFGNDDVLFASEAVASSVNFNRSCPVVSFSDITSYLLMSRAHTFSMPSPVFTPLSDILSLLSACCHRTVEGEGQNRTST